MSECECEYVCVSERERGGGSKRERIKREIWTACGEKVKGRDIKTD